MINPDWTYNYLTGAQSAANLQASLPDDDNDAIISVASFQSGDEEEEITFEANSVYKTITRCFISNAADGMLIGAATAGAFSVFPVLIRGKFRRALSAPFNKGTVKVSMFFGILMGLYNTGRFVVRTKQGNQKRKLSARALRVLVAIVIGYSGSLLSKRVRKFIALFLLSRAVETKSKDIYRNMSSKSQTAIAPYVDKADLVLSIFSMGINGCAWIMAPHLLDTSYLRFLDGTSGYSTRALRDSTQLFNPNVAFDRHCQMLHPDNKHGCAVELSKFAVKQYFSDSIRFYYKLYAIPLLIATIKKRKLSITALRYFVQRTARSSLFLTSGGVAMTSMFCLFDKLDLPPSPALPFLAGMSAGSLVCIEPKSRRVELSLYLFTQALHASAAFYASRGWWYPAGTDLLAIAVGFYHVISAYEDSMRDDGGEASLLRPFYVSTMKKLFDYEQIDPATPRSRKPLNDTLHAWTVTKYWH